MSAREPVRSPIHNAVGSPMDPMPGASAAPAPPSSSQLQIEGAVDSLLLEQGTDILMLEA